MKSAPAEIGNQDRINDKNHNITYRDLGVCVCVCMRTYMYA